LINKLEMIARQDRFNDVHDAAAILKELTDGVGKPLSMQKLMCLSTESGFSITQEALTRVNNHYAFAYRSRGLI
jgi:hypothetical protein